jgi:protein SCO1/2
MQLAELAAGIHALPAREQRRITTIFVTVDPARDSTAPIRTWLDQFSRTFIGLRAPLDATNRVLAALARPAAMDGAPSTTVAPRIGHGTEILAFTADDSAHVAYPIGAGRADWTTDLHDVLRHDPDRSRS